MATKNLFEYAILHQPKATRDAQGNDTTPDTTILKPITPVLAACENDVKILAARAIDEKHLQHLDEVVIIVRPL
jgi:hypothetical protein